ncbi:MAG: hypothetical protein KBC64_00820 [Simkaniaceae bacterium]|nr:hypothetical protein [Simkaniaceae bacterium]
MLNVNFSLTETCVINPILNIRQNRTSFFETEIVTRIIAVAISVFAAVDVILHFSIGVVKGSLLLCRRIFHLNPPTWTTNEVATHFKKSSWYTRVVLFGSFIGILSPRAARRACIYPQPVGPQRPPPITPQPNPVVPPAPTTGLPSAALQQAIQDVHAGVDQAPFPALRAAWVASSLSDRHWFVDLFNQGTDAISEAVRENMADIVYRPIKPSLAGRPVQWLAPQEVDQRINEIWGRAHTQQHAFFFHATREVNSLQGILTSRHIEVRHQQRLRGAFVSTLPEEVFGQYILGFKKNIERLSPLTHGISNPAPLIGVAQVPEQTYWAGFSQNIPVTEETLAYVAIQGTEDERRTLQDQCTQWAGRPIEVRLLNDAKQEIDAVHNLDLGIPVEWAS